MREAFISPYSTEGGGVGILGDFPIIETLRATILYWDSATIPIVLPGALPELDNVIAFLVGNGAVSTYNIKEDNSIDMSVDIRLFAADFLEKALRRQQKDGDILSIVCPLEDSRNLIAYFQFLVGQQGRQYAYKKQVLEVSLRNALPAPPHDATFGAILDFKRRRLDELQQLHHAIDCLSTQLSGAESLDDAVRVGQAIVSRALADLDRVFSETWPGRLLSTMRANLGSVVVGAGTGAVAAPLADIPAALGAAAGGALRPVFEASVNTVIGRHDIPERAAPYLYAYTAGREIRPA